MSEYFLIEGGTKLEGSVEVSGAKNSVLKLMAASLLASGRTTLKNCPEILDVQFMAMVLEGLGAKVTINGATVIIDSPEVLEYNAVFPAMKHFRASVCVLGPLMGRCRKAIVALPGGDAIGTRPLDMHRSGLEAMGAKTSIEHGCLFAEADDLGSANCSLPWPSVGATENIIMASVLSSGVTVIDNAAREPEIIDLCNMLVSMGASIEGIGTSTVMVRGVSKLHSTNHTVVGDRLVAATWATAAVMTQGDIVINGVEPNHLIVVLDKFTNLGAEISVTDSGIEVKQLNRPKALKVSTLPYPGFPTDLQAMAIAIASIAEGVSIITENVFESRFRFVEEMIRLGADARVDGHHAVIRGKEKLSSAPVWSSDVRAGAGLVLAGICAHGFTEVHDIFHIDRGYPRFMENLKELGAKIERVKND